MPNLIILFGPPASGKSAIGHELAALTGYRFFHNHLTADPVGALFGYGSPRFGALVDAVRELLLREAAADAAMAGIVFTFVWALDLPQDNHFIRKTEKLFADAGGEVMFVELLASLNTRIEREGTPFRVGLKPALRDVAAARGRQTEMAARYRMNATPGEMGKRKHLVIDTETMEPAGAARHIAQVLGLPRNITE
jgi:hypothetical protein